MFSVFLGSLLLVMSGCVTAPVRYSSVEREVAANQRVLYSQQQYSSQSITRGVDRRGQGANMYWSYQATSDQAHRQVMDSDAADRRWSELDLRRQVAEHRMMLDQRRQTERELNDAVRRTDRQVDTWLDTVERGQRIYDRAHSKH